MKCFQPPSLLIRKIWVPLFVSYTLQRALKKGQEGGIVQIYFSNHQGILYKLCSVGIGGSVLTILTKFLSNRSHHVIVDGCLSKLVNIVGGVPQGSVLWPLLFILWTTEIFSIPENKLIGYAEDSTLLDVVLFPARPLSYSSSP